MSCDRTIELIEQAISGSLEIDWEEIVLHLAECEQCRAPNLEHSPDALARAAETYEALPRFREEIHRKLRGRRPSDAEDLADVVIVRLLSAIWRSPERAQLPRSPRRVVRNLLIDAARKPATEELLELVDQAPIADEISIEREKLRAVLNVELPHAENQAIEAELGKRPIKNADAHRQNLRRARKRLRGR